VGLWSDLEQVRQTCSAAEQLCSAILGSSATAAYCGLAQTDVYPHRSLLLELTARTLPCCPLFLEMRVAHQPECRLFLFSDLLLLRGQPLPHFFSSLAKGWAVDGPSRPSPTSSLFRSAFALSRIASASTASETSSPHRDRTHHTRLQPPL
jgi:hypothetical protein